MSSLVSQHSARATSHSCSIMLKRKGQTIPPSLPILSNPLFLAPLLYVGVVQSSSPYAVKSVAGKCCQRPPLHPREVQQQVRCLVTHLTFQEPSSWHIRGTSYPLARLGCRSISNGSQPHPDLAPLFSGHTLPLESAFPAAKFCHKLVSSYSH